jgi:pimeloyl-ACP methyl ester carboxylesterase
MNTSHIPLLLLPGLLCDRALWVAQLEGLADIADMTVGDLTGADSVAGMAKAALAVAPERFALAGLSMGGYVSLEIMRQAPQRVMRLALLDTSARADTPERIKQRQDQLALCNKGEFVGVTRRLLPSWIHPEHMKDEALVQAVTTMTKRVGRDAFCRQVTAIMNRPDSRPTLATIECPTLVLCGHEDQATPPELHREIAADVGGARLVIIPECGHLSTMEQPEQVNRELRAWLGGD